MKIIIIALFIITSHVVFSQSKYKNVLITDENEPTEVSIMINPTDVNNIVAAANIDNFFYSLDGGYTWAVRKVTSIYGVWGDPCIVADTKGNFYYFHLSNSYDNGGKWLDRMICQKSIDGGITWSNGTYFGLNPPHLQDKEWAAVDLTYSPYRDNIYSAWTQCGQNSYDGVSVNPIDSASNILFSVSTDGGNSWSTHIRLNEISGAECMHAENTVLGAMPCVGLSGEVYVVWASPGGIILDRSTDGGFSWLDEDIKVSDIPGGFRYYVPGVYRTFGFPSMACDMSNSPYRGTLFISWADQRSGTDNTDVWISSSTDEGLTWAEPQKINDDTGESHQFFSWLTIDPTTGYLYIVFYDRRNYTDDQTDVYIAISKDGGRTFVNERISESPFIPASSTFMGDYTNVSALNGVVRPVWTRLDTNKLSVWTAIVE